MGLHRGRENSGATDAFALHKEGRIVFEHEVVRDSRRGHHRSATVARIGDEMLVRNVVWVVQAMIDRFLYFENRYGPR